MYELKTAAEIVEMSRPRGSFVGYFVYFLIDGDEIVYVGKTTRPYARIRQHELSDKVFDRILVGHTGSKYEMDAKEALYIVEFNPRYNKSLPLDNTEFIKKGEMKRWYGAYPLNRAIKALGLRPVYEKGDEWYTWKQQDAIDAYIKEHESHG